LRFDNDTWLTGVIGKTCWKVIDVRADDAAPTISRELHNRSAHAPCFFSAKIPTRDVVTLANATQAGFFVVDVNVTFDWLATADSRVRKYAPDNGLSVGVAERDDEPGIEEIAAHCFTFSRFHLDPIIQVSVANNIKREWARSALASRAAEIYVARQHDNVGGFLAVLETKTQSGSDAIIDLVGVDARFQGKGAGGALSQMFVERWKDRANRLRVGTQISNIPAMRLYESLGFRVTETSYVLHAHTKSGGILT
jgi:dTDP-4-amino-4,6-dideoxy-D-galactose acyltransferase